MESFVFHQHRGTLSFLVTNVVTVLSEISLGAPVDCGSGDMFVRVALLILG